MHESWLTYAQAFTREAAANLCCMSKILLSKILLQHTATLCNTLQHSSESVWCVKNIYNLDMYTSHVRHSSKSTTYDSFISASRLVHIRISHVTCKWAMLHMNESCHTWMSHVTHERAMSHTKEPCHTWMSNVIHEWAMSHMNESCHTWMSHVTHERVMSHGTSHARRATVAAPHIDVPGPAIAERWNFSQKISLLLHSLKGGENS